MVFKIFFSNVFWWINRKYSSIIIWFFFYILISRLIILQTLLERKLVSWMQANTSWCFFQTSQATKLVLRRHKSWLAWKPVEYQFTLQCSYSRLLYLSLYESKSWIWFKLWNASLLWLTKLTSVPSNVALIINLGVYSDALMIMKQSRTRLVTASCASHQLELLLKDVVKENP